MAAIVDQLTASDPPDLGPGPHPHAAPPAALSAQLAGLLRSTADSEPLLRCAALIWHGYLDAAHEIAQNLASADGSLLHAIIHRREPDYSNARYWFNRVGAHPAYPAIGRSISQWLADRKAAELSDRLVPGGQWNALAFVHECESLKNNPARRELLRELQALELRTLIDFWARP